MLRQSVVNYAPPKFVHWAKSIMSGDYRRRSRELARIKSIPRYQKMSTNILGKEIEAVDSASFLSMYIDIFERQAYRFLTDVESPLIIDCGANIGLSVLYFKQLYPASRIIAFEPDQDICEMLQRNVDHWALPDVETHCRAVWSSATKVLFHRDGADGGHMAVEDDARDEMVETVRLRDYLDQPVDFLKIDIEGAEGAVLMDCRDRLQNVKRLFVEYHSFTGRPQDFDLVTEIVAAAGFRVYIQSVIFSEQPFISRVCDGPYDMQLNLYAYRD